ncbi:MAG: phage/plasmid primase, P4 family [Pseudomonadota bacterium]
MSEEQIDTWALAQDFAREHHLFRMTGQWFLWVGPCYQELDKDLLQKMLAMWLVDRGKKPGSGLINTIRSHLISLRAQAAVSLPTWKGKPLAENILSCRNLLVDLDTGNTFPHTPEYINLNALDYDYDPDAGEPTEWLKFLNSLWDDDPECIQVLQRIFGYLLSTDTSMHRMFQLMGPPRSGKGTIGDVMAEVIGRKNVCSPSLQNIAGNFGLSPAIGKQLMLLSEARLDGRTTNRGAITDVLLRVTGEDHFTIDRKHKEAWEGVLTSRIVIQTNEPLELADDTSALLSRLIVLPMTRSFKGKEDLGLKRRLRTERGAILKWGIEGWRLLKSDGGMIRQPPSGEEVLEATRAAASPLTGFLDECCGLDPDANVDKQALYQAYRRWCDGNGSKPVPLGKLTSVLQASYNVRQAKGPWIDKQLHLREPRVYRGIKLISRPEPPF